MKKLVSVIIPAFNAEKYISDTINSVLGQTYSYYEIIIINDGSTDGTEKIVKQFSNRIIYIKQRNKGISAARNAGIRKAKGEFIAFLDADDIWMPAKLEKQIDYLNSHPDVDVVFSLAQNTLNPKADTKPTKKFPVIPAYVPPNCLFRRKTIDTVGLFDEKINLGEFVDWYAKILSSGIKIGCVNSLLLLRRIHGENIGIRRKTDQIEYVRILKRKLDHENLQV